MMGASESRARRRLKLVNKSTACNEPCAIAVPDDRDQLAVCLASISDLALTGVDGLGCSQRCSIDRQMSSSSPGGAIHVVDPASLQVLADDLTATSAPCDVTGQPRGSGGSVSSRSLRHKIRRKVQRHRSMPAAEENINNQLRMINSLDNQDDDSTDWAMMRSWMVWCLRDKLGDTELLSSRSVPTTDEDDFPSLSVPVPSPSSTASHRRPMRPGGGSMGGGPPRLVRQLAVQERSPRTAGSSGRLGPGGGSSQRLQCARDLQGSSLDGSGWLTVGTNRSAQSSFESYGSAG